MGSNKYDGSGKRIIKLDHKQKVLVALTLVCAMARYTELMYDYTRTESETEQFKKLDTWWRETLNEKQRTKIETWMRRHAEENTGTPQHSQEHILILVSSYCRMLQLRYQLKKGYQENEWSKRLEYEWNLLGQQGQFKVVSWVKELHQGYEQMTVLI